MRILRILRHPIRWLFGQCFICGHYMLFDDPKFIGNKYGFCFTHGNDGWK